MSEVIIIPARLQSSRLPNKLLLAATGTPLIGHTVLQALRCKRASHVIVSADDQSLLEAVRQYPVLCQLSGEFETGTERVAWTYERVRRSCTNEWFINWQADEPTLTPESVDELIGACHTEFSGAAVVTLACPATAEEANDPNTVKVVVRRDGCALYFSRSRIPYAGPVLRHIGIYAFNRRFFTWQRLCRPSVALAGERLEQLAWLEAGYSVSVLTLPSPDGGGIDVQADYDRFVQEYGRQIPSTA